METNANQHDKTRKALVSLVARVVIYSALAVLVGIIGNLFWWFGLVLFLVFAFYILWELVANGIVLVIIAVVSRIVFRRVTDYRVLSSADFGKRANSLRSLFGISGVMIAIQIYYLSMVLLLAFYLFGKHG